MSNDKEWLGCSGCGSVWLGVLAEARDDICPYCRSNCEIVPVQGPSFSPTRSDDAPKMAIGEAVGRLDAAVAAYGCDRDLVTALKTVSDTVENLIKERDALERQIGLQLALSDIERTNRNNTVEDLIQNGLGLLAGAVEYVCDLWSNDPESTPVWVDDALFVLDKYGKGPKLTVLGQATEKERQDNCCPRCGDHWITHRADGGDCAADDKLPCPLPTKPRVHAYVFGEVVECDEKPDCVDVVITYDELPTAAEIIKGQMVLRDIAQALETLEAGDIGAAADQLRALV